MNKLKVIFMGTPEFAVPTLKALNELYNVVGVVCQPDKPSDRGEVKYSPIKEYAVNNNLNVIQPASLKDDYSQILVLEPEMIVTCAYGQLIPREVFEFPKYGCINVHASLLPKLRGGAPIHRAIIEGFSETGITIMKTALKLDAGDILSQSKVSILDTDTAGSLHDRLSFMGRDLLVNTIPKILDGTITYTKQNESEATFASNIKREDEKIDYMKSNREIVNQIRGLNPWPGAYSILSGKIVKIWGARMSDVYPPDDFINGQITTLYDNGIGVKCENGEVIIAELQLEGKRKMSANEFINGAVNKELLVGRIFE